MIGQLDRGLLALVRSVGHGDLIADAVLLEPFFERLAQGFARLADF